jgi:hypothetical protein
MNESFISLVVIVGSGEHDMEKKVYLKAFLGAMLLEDGVKEQSWKDWIV